MPDYMAGKARILLEPVARGFFSKAKGELRADFAGKTLTQDVKLTPYTAKFNEDSRARLASLQRLTKDVKLTPDATTFHTKAQGLLLEKKLWAKAELRPFLQVGFRKSAQTQIDTALAGLGKDIHLDVDLNLARINTQLTAWRAKEERNPLRIRVIADHVGGVGRGGVGTGGLQRRAPGNTHLAGLNAPQRNAQVTVTANTAPAAAKIAAVTRPRKVKVDVDNDVLKHALARLDAALRPKRRIGPSIRGVELLSPSAISLSSAALPFLTMQALRTVAAINQLSGAMAAVPGAMATAGTSIATFALGISGMGDALKAMTQEQDRQANQATSDAARFEQGQTTMRNALVDQQRAQEDLTKARKDARRNLEDLHAEERSTYLSVAEAALDLQKARNELAQGSAGPMEHDEQVIRELRARESLSEAMKRQRRTREDVNTEDKKGIEGSDQVVQAQEALVRSNQAIAQTLQQIAMESSAASNAHDKVTAAMAKLSPNAAELTQTLFDLKDKGLVPLAGAASQTMFAGLSAEIKTLVSSDFPILERGVAGVGRGINRNLLTLGQSLRTPGTQDMLTRLFGNTEEFHNRLNAAIDPAIRSLNRLIIGGSNAMPKLATAFAHSTDKFAEFLDKADKEGRLDRWINNGIDGLSSLSRTLGSLIRMAEGLGRAFGTDNMLGSIERVTKKWADFLNSGEGQHSITTLIEMVKRDLDDWRPILQDLPGIFMAVMNGARDAMHGLLPVINTITSFMREFPGITSAAMTGFIAWRGITPILAAAQTGLIGVRTGLTNLSAAVMPATRSAETGAGRMGDAFRNRAAGGLSALSTRLSSVAGFLGGPWGIAISTAVIALSGLITGQNDAKEAADAHQQAEARLAGTLEDVTNAAGAASRAMVAKEMEDYHPDHGLTGNVRQAAEKVGVGRDQMLAAIMPGGAAQAAAAMKTFTDKARAGVIDAVPAEVKFMLNNHGISDDDIVQAFLGDQTRVKKIQDFYSSAAGIASKAIVRPWDLGRLQQEVTKRGGETLDASLAAQFLNRTAPAVAGAQTAAQQAQITATGGAATLTAGGHAMFDRFSPQVSYDGKIAAIRAKDLDPNVIANLKARNNQVDYDQVSGWSTVKLTNPEDQAALVNLPRLPSRKEGGPTPELGQPGPTGGVVIEAHPKEWILPEHARNALGDEFLWNVTKNRSGISPAFWHGKGRRGGLQDPQKDGPPMQWTDLPSIPGEPDIRYPGRIGQSAGGRDPFSFWVGGPIPLGGGDVREPSPVPSPIHPTPAGVPGPTPTPGLPAPSGSLPGPIPKTVDPAPKIVGPEVPGQSRTGTPADDLLNGPMPVTGPDGSLTTPLSPDGPTAFNNAFNRSILGNLGAINARNQQPGNAGQYLGNFAGNFLSSFGSTLLEGVFGFFGMSSNNTYLNAMKQTLGFFTGPADQNQNVDPATQALVSGANGVGGYTQLVDPATGTTYLVPNDSAGASADGSAALGDLANLPAGKAPETGLQPNAIKANRAISATFPEITTIGGVRADSLHWHPDGLALDVMIPGQKGNNDPTTPEGLAEGNKIWAWLKQHASELGVDMGASLWQQKDHYNHIHVAVYGKNNPGPGGKETPAGGESGEVPTTAPASPEGLPPLVIPGAGGRGGRRNWGGIGGHAGTLGSLFSGAGIVGGQSEPMLGGGGSFGGSAPGVRPYGPHSVDPIGGSPGDLVGPMPELGGNYAGPGGGGGGRRMPGLSMGGRGGIVILPPGSSIGDSLRALRGGRSGGAPGGPAPAGPYSGGTQDTHDAVYRAFRQAGFVDSQWPAVVQILNHESGWDPNARNPSSGAARLFQFLGHENDEYAGGYSPDPYTQAIAGMKYIKNRYGDPNKAWQFWQGHNWYDVPSALLKPGVTVAHNDTNVDEVVMQKQMAQRAVAAISDTAQRMRPIEPPSGPRMGQAPPPDADVPQALKEADQVPQQAMQQEAPPQQAPVAPAGGQGGAGDTQHLHPGIAMGIKSGAATLGNLAATAASAMGGGAGAAGPLIAGAFQQGGKIVSDAANVAATFASGFLQMGGTTPNPYGVQLQSKAQPPALASDNRRVHQGDNYFANMDEWRARNQLIDSQDMQVALARTRV